MKEPECPKKGPYTLNLNAGTYWWCACGRSKNQPFCDGAHQGSGFQPMEIKLERPEKVWLCGCKRSGKKPLCDGAHNTLIEET